MFSISAVRKVIQDQVDAPDHDRSAHVDQAPVDRGEVLGHGESEEVVKRDRDVVGKNKAEERGCVEGGLGVGGRRGGRRGEEDG